MGVAIVIGGAANGGAFEACCASAASRIAVAISSSVLDGSTPTTRPLKPNVIRPPILVCVSGPMPGTPTSLSFSAARSTLRTSALHAIEARILVLGLRRGVAGGGGQLRARFLLADALLLGHASGDFLEAWVLVLSHWLPPSSANGCRRSAR